MPTTLQRQDFQTSRVLEYFSAKELTLQTGHEPDRWPEVILKTLLDNALDACETHGIVPDITVTITDGAIQVQDNGPGLGADVVSGVLDFGVRLSSKDAYISPTRGAQGNALKTILAVPYVISDGQPEPITITSQGQCHRITVGLDRIAQEPQIPARYPASAVRSGISVEVRLATLNKVGRRRLLPLVRGYSLFNPHATIAVIQGSEVHAFTRRTEMLTTAYQRAIYIHAMNAELERFHETAKALAVATVPPADLRQSIERRAQRNTRPGPGMRRSAR